MAPVSIDLILARRWSGSGVASLEGAEVISESDDIEEFVEAGNAGELIHRISPARSYVKRVGPVPLGPYLARVAEKAYELEALWNRQVRRFVCLDESGSIIRRLWPRIPVFESLSALDAAPRPPTVPIPIRSVDIICCSYNRFAEILVSLEGMLQQALSATESGLPTHVNLVYQNEWLPRRLFEHRPEWREHPRLRFTRSDPGLPRARNVGLASSSGDLVIFVDDDVQLDPHFIQSHVAAAHAHPGAVGIAGRIRSRTLERSANNDTLSVGQVRASGWVDDNFDSIGRQNITVIPHTPRGANMAFRRAKMNAAFGAKWFDESLEGSAHREETTLGIEIFRRGLHLAYEPGACLLHLECETGGCENRGPLTLDRRASHAALDQLFLRRFYAPAPALRPWAPLLSVLRAVRQARGAREKITTSWAQWRGFNGGRRMFADRLERQGTMGTSANTTRLFPSFLTSRGLTSGRR